MSALMPNCPPALHAVQAEGSMPVFGEIERRVAQVRAQAARRGVALAAPLLALGVSERVGSNWLSDALRPVLVQHNEPIRQQLGPAHPFSPLNPAPPRPGEVEVDGLGAHWLACLVASTYGQPQHMIKETNLFFAAAGVLRLFPDAPVAALTRSPLGVASSFTKGRLWERWHYADRYAQVAATTRLPAHRRWAVLLPADEPEPLVGVVRLVVAGALLLAEALPGREYTVVSYEEHVTDRAAVVARLERLLGVPVPAVADQPGRRSEGSAVDDTFATTAALGKNELVAVLDQGQADLVRACTAEALDRAREVTDPGVVTTAAGWLAGDHLYHLRPPAADGAHRRPRRPAAAASVQPGYVRTGGILWRNLLVSNAEFAQFLTLLHAAGAPNTRAGTHLLACVMPHERGGRLHLDDRAGLWRASPGYADHPVYWVTWIGAAAYAAWQGARLPTRAEALAATADAAATNHDYAVGDVLPVAERGKPADQVHHLVGNLQIWCADGPTCPSARPAERHLVGAAWNTPARRADITAPRSRHLLGSSRGVGIRLVRETSTPTRRVTPAELAARLNAWVDDLADRGRPLAALDHLVIDALSPPGSQTDRRLRPHVGARAGKTVPA